MLLRSPARSLSRCFRSASTLRHNRQQHPQIAAATSAYQQRAHRKQQQLYWSLLAVIFGGGVATLSQFYLNSRITHAEAPAEDDNAIVFEKSRKQAGASKEENRDLISSQHHQVKRSWENPGVYAWGSNTGRVVAPDSSQTVIKTPRRIAWFDGKLLRDVKLDRNFGAAIDEKGDLLQWGTGYSDETTEPTPTLQGKNLISLAISRDRIIGLSKNGTVYSVPVSAEDQAVGTKVAESSWIPFWSWTSPIAYRILAPKGLKSGENINALAGGLEHAVLLSSSGRVFSAATASDRFPSKGQLGVPGLTWLNRPEGSFDRPHEITTLKGFEISKVACGDYHSIALDKEGRIFTWGDNSCGQIGFEITPESSIVDAPCLLPLARIYSGTNQRPLVTSVAAGGNNSYFTVDATRVAARPGALQFDDDDPKLNRGLGKITADTFALGTGIRGQLANNRWTHMQTTPVKVPALSGLFEFDEVNLVTVPIRLAHLSVGTTHAAAVMSNITNTSTGLGDSTDTTNWGADIVFWGGNEHYQLGTGKRNNLALPTYIAPLDLAAEVARAKRSSGTKEDHRFHITPRTTTIVGSGKDARKVSVEQRVECGNGVTAVYSGT